MTIWTQNTEILYPIIVTISVNMVKFQRYSTINRPFRPPAFFTKRLF